MLQDIAAPKIGASDFLSSYTDSTGRSLKEYRLPKDLTVTLVTGYRADLRYKVVKRVEELENATRFATLPNFNDPIAAARAWIEAKELEQTAKKALEVAAPKIEAYECFIEAKQENMNLQRSMKILGYGPNRAIKALRDASVLYGTPATPYQYYRDQGYFVMLPVADKNEPGKIRPQTFVAPKGLDWLRRKLPELMVGGQA